MTNRFRPGEPLSAAEKGPESFAALVRFASAICDLVVDENEEGQVALAWAVLNRLNRFGPNGGADARGEYGAALAASCCHVAFLRAMALACLIMSGDLEDPTDGATHFHRHDEDPGWCSAARPKALIGDHLFYEVEESAFRTIAMYREGCA